MSNSKKGGGFSSLVASLTIAIAVVIGFVIYHKILGNPANFEGVEKEGEITHHGEEQSRALADEHCNAQHRVQHMHLHSQRNAHGSGQPGPSALCITAAGDHGEIGAWADDGEQGEQGDGDEFGHAGGSR